MLPTAARRLPAIRKTLAKIPAAVRKGRSKLFFVIMSIFEVGQCSQAMAFRQLIDARRAVSLLSADSLDQLASEIPAASKPAESASATVLFLWECEMKTS